MGGGVVDRLRQLRINVIGVDFGSGPDGFSVVDTGVKYANKRAEIWGEMRTWLATGSIPDIKIDEDLTLVDELTAPTYDHNKKEEIQLESKKDMRRRGVKSPNVADALACTFAFPHYEVLPGTASEEKEKPVVLDDYDPYQEFRKETYA